MRKNARHSALLGLLLAAAGLPATSGDAWAFSSTVRAEIAHRAGKLMPPALNAQLRRHEAAVREGALAGVPDGPGPVAALDPGDADRRLAAAIERAVKLLDGQAPMREVARVFGEIARAAADLSYALGVGPDDPREPSIAADWSRFVESRFRRIKPTFAGWSDPDLARGDVFAFARRTAQSARRDYDGILRSYFPEGRPRAAQDFDDRSVAFASASLSVSLALTTTARAWLYAWTRAHGDLTGTPFLGAN